MKLTRRRHALAFAFVLVTLALASATATAMAEPLVPGTRVRVTLLERLPAESPFVGQRSLAARPLIGRVLDVQPDVLVLEPEDSAGTRLTLRRPGIARLEISRGRHSRAGRGALIGLLGGALGGTLLGVHRLTAERESQGFEPIVFGLVGAFGGLGLGALIGSSIHVEGWQPAPPP